MQRAVKADMIHCSTSKPQQSEIIPYATKSYYNYADAKLISLFEGLKPYYPYPYKRGGICNVQQHS